MSRVIVHGPSLEVIVDRCLSEIQTQLPSRAYRGANELRNSSIEVLRGQGSGRRYRVPGTRRYYSASAPGEVPAVRTDTFRPSWKPKTSGSGTSFKSIIETDVKYAEWLENGTPGGQMAPRPHHEKIQNDALPKIVGIYDEPYF